VTLVRSSIPERDLGGVGLGCAAGAAVVLVLVLLCSWGWVVHYYSFLAAHAVHLCAVRAAGFRGETAHEVGQRRPGRHRHYTGGCCSLLLFLYNRSDICWHSRRGVFLLLYRNSPARMFFRSLLTRGAGSSSACSATSPRRSSASSGGALVLGLLGAARWCRLLTQRRVRQCSGGGLGARARHAPRFSLAANIGRGRLGFVVVVLLRSVAQLLIASLLIT